MTGAHSKMVEVMRDPFDTSDHGAPMRWVAIDLPSAANRSDVSIPTKQMFSEGNGGESRKSFHGYPRGFAQLIESPQTWQVGSMPWLANPMKSSPDSLPPPPTRTRIAGHRPP